MLFSSIPFLYYFLPAVFLVYFLVPQKAKNTVLLVSSLVFYAWGEPKYVFLMIATIAVFYLCGLGIAASRKKKFFLVLSVVIAVYVVCLPGAAAGVASSSFPRAWATRGMSSASTGHPIISPKPRRKASGHGAKAAYLPTTWSSMSPTQKTLALSASQTNRSIWYS